ncbi:MAG: hypothetical protein HKN43_03695 [Rhodothermales bacterium]|nr:hypothetical protein [Rhodothermales bacterium]
MNYFRSELIQRLTGIIVSGTLLLSVVVPLSGIEITAKDRAALQLFGQSLDIPVDGVFLSSWQTALNSDAPTLKGFVEAFVGSYERSNGIEAGSLPQDTHVLWAILEGISLNIDPWGIAATLSSGLKSTVLSSTTQLPASAIRSSGDKSALREVWTSTALWKGAVHLRSVLTPVNPQGP